MATQPLPSPLTNIGPLSALPRRQNVSIRILLIRQQMILTERLCRWWSTAGETTARETYAFEVFTIGHVGVLYSLPELPVPQDTDPAVLWSPPVRRLAQQPRWNSGMPFPVAT